MARLAVLLLSALCASSWGSSIFRAGPGPDKSALAPKPFYLSVPLDHFAEESGTWPLKYYVDDSFYQPGGPLVVAMPQEIGLNDIAAGGYMTQSAPWASTLKALIVTPEHRFFGSSVPNNDSSVANYRYHTVEQSLADVVTLIDHMRETTKSVANVVAVGGSYSGALAAWIRKAYPKKIDAAIAHSPVVSAFMDFPQFGISNLVALSSPDSRCAYSVGKIMQAVSRQYKENKIELYKLFRASHLLHAPVGDFTFMFGAGLSLTASVQGGGKDIVCLIINSVTDNYTKEDLSDEEYAKAIGSYPPLWSTFNFTEMRGALNGDDRDGQRPWWWMKCTQLGWFKTGPRSGMSAVPFEDLDVAAFLDACSYIFPNASLVDDQKIVDFNARFGGADQLNVTRVFTVDYSDDPWKMATITSLVEREKWPLGETQPFMLLTCDGCGHCGAGAPADNLKSIEEQELYYLNRWLNHKERVPLAVLV